MSKRGMGKVASATCRTKPPHQLYARRDEMDEAVYNAFKSTHRRPGGVEGGARTQRGDERAVQERHPPVQVPAASAGEVPRPAGQELRYRRGTWT
ncbi:MAG: hypothetical protein ACLS43_09480 [Evtepia gabavorous]